MYQFFIKKLYISWFLSGCICSLLFYTYFNPFCNKNGQKKEGKSIVIVATTGMIGDAVRQIVKERGEVTVLMGPGVDPHSYEATPRDGEKLESADIVFYNGLHLEGPMEPIFKTLASAKPVYAVCEALSPGDILNDPLFPAGKDPHIWFDILLWVKVVSYISGKLEECDPKNREFYRKNANAYIKELDRLFLYINSLVRNIPDEYRIIVSAHTALNYFCRRHSLRGYGIQGTSTMSELGVKNRKDLEELIKKNSVHVIFAETSVNDRHIRAIIESCRRDRHEVSIASKKLYSDSLGEGEEATYVGMMRSNALLIAEELKKNGRKKSR